MTISLVDPFVDAAPVRAARVPLPRSGNTRDDDDARGGQEGGGVANPRRTRLPSA